MTCLKTVIKLFKVLGSDHDTRFMKASVGAITLQQVSASHSCNAVRKVMCVALETGW